MRFMIMVRATQDTEAGRQAPESLFAEMAAYHEALAPDRGAAEIEVRQLCAAPRLRELLPVAR